jgi:hypothetical protein
VSGALTLTVLAGGTIGLGVTVIVRELLPSDPQLAAALDRMRPPPLTLTARTSTPNTSPSLASSRQDGGTQAWETRVGAWSQRRLSRGGLPWTGWVPIPTRELTLLQLPVTRFLGQKVLMGLVGLLFPVLFTAMTAALGYPLPIVLPALGSVLLGAGLFMIPDLEVRRRSGAAREDFARATCAYLDLTALERSAGSGATQALEQAATVGDSWVFLRLREELLRARLSGTAPWEGLHTLATELALPELSDLADIMRLSGEEGAAVAESLRARSRGLRAALLSKEQTRANENSERMVIPVALLGLIFMVILGAPAISRIL